MTSNLIARMTAGGPGPGPSPSPSPSSSPPRAPARRRRRPRLPQGPSPAGGSSMRPRHGSTTVRPWLPPTRQVESTIVQLHIGQWTDRRCRRQVRLGPASSRGRTRTSGSANAASTNAVRWARTSATRCGSALGHTASSFVISKGAGTTGQTAYALVMSSGTRPTAELSRPGETSRLLIEGNTLTDTNWHRSRRRSSALAWASCTSTASSARAPASSVASNVDLTNTRPLTIGAHSSGGEGFAGNRSTMHSCTAKS